MTPFFSSCVLTQVEGGPLQQDPVTFRCNEKKEWVMLSRAPAVTQASERASVVAQGGGDGNVE